MTTQDRILSILKRWLKRDDVAMDNLIFRDGLNMSSIAFTEFIMEVEEEFEADIDVDSLDESIKTVGQLLAKLDSMVSQG
ncbi:MAG: phosphopantetheine-binding protein [Gemmobacter sp.]|nr:phosphopantetheine-binding protein [Gemmobacter sp.]